MELEDRIARLEAESQIRQLVARYCFTVDGRDVDGIAALFTQDAVVRSADGVMNACGVDAIIDQYHGRFAVLGAGSHVTHDLALDFDAGAAAEARGLVSAHAELWRQDRMMVAALRYQDRYRNTDRGWLFAERVISFLYYVPFADYGAILGRRDRNRAYAAPQPADYPERLESWIAYQASAGVTP